MSTAKRQGQQCPGCQSGATKTLETRRNGAITWRRYRCGGCNRAFVSREMTGIDMKMPPEMHNFEGLKKLHAKRKEKSAYPRPRPPLLDLTTWKRAPDDTNA